MAGKRFAAKNVTGLKARIAISMANYIEAGSIIAAASSLTLWQAYLGFENIGVGILSALSANALGAAIGALIGGPLTDKYGRKIVFNYDLMVYIFGVALIAASFNFPDRKSTRLNSSHVAISYAVFCLKKKIQRSREV